MNLTQRRCKVSVLDDLIEFLVHANCDDVSGDTEMKNQRCVVINELNHQAKRLQRKLPGMKGRENNDR